MRNYIIIRIPFAKRINNLLEKTKVYQSRYSKLISRLRIKFYLCKSSLKTRKRKLKLIKRFLKRTLLAGVVLLKKVTKKIFQIIFQINGAAKTLMSNAPLIHKKYFIFTFTILILLSPGILVISINQYRFSQMVAQCQILLPKGDCTNFVRTMLDIN